MYRCAWLWIIVGMNWLLPPAQASEPWAQWRGPKGDGHVVEQSPPVQFTAKNVVWKTSLPGQGQSSPVLWDEHIFLTTALEAGRERVVLSVNRATGKIEWQQTAWTGQPESSHQMNGWASATCATDGEHVYAFFGHGGGLFCYTKTGEKVWSKELGEFVGPWGTAACPILYENLVIQNCDSESNASLTAFDKLTGKVVWTSPREDFRGWSTPFLFHGHGEPQLVLNGHTGVRSYNPVSGQELWFCSSAVGRGEPTVTPDADGRLIVVNGLRGAVYAVAAKGTGDVSQSQRLWQFPRKTDRDLPSPAVVGNRLLIMSMKGILTCCDSTNGAIVWEERVGGNYSASPVVLGNVALFVSEAGEVVVIDPVGKDHIVARNSVGASDTEIFRSSLAADNDQWLLRSDKVLYCISERN